MKFIRSIFLLILLFVDVIASAATVHLVWDAPPLQSDHTVAGYRMYRDSTQVGIMTSAVLEYFDTVALPGNTYYYYVTAYDTDGNESVPSNTVSATIPATVSPNVSFSGNSSTQSVSDGNIIINISFDGSSSIQETTTGAIKGSILLSGSSSSSVNSQGDIQFMPLVGYSFSESTALGGLDTSISLLGDSISSSNSLGEIIFTQLYGDSISQSSVIGVLNITQTGLEGQSFSYIYNTGILTVDPPLTSQAPYLFISKISRTAANVNWITTYPAKVTLLWGRTPTTMTHKVQLGSVKKNGIRVAEISGLTRNTTYYCQITAYGKLNSIIFPVMTFTTSK